MDQDDEQGYKLFCIAIVAKDKPADSDIIDFFPVEKLTFENDEVTTETEDTDVVATDIEGVAAKVTVKRGKTMKARWMQNGADGRHTSPDVVNAETVKIYRFRDSEEFFWTTMMREPQLRRLEHVAYVYSNLKEGRKAYDMNSSYGNMWSTRDQHITFWTSDSNGEKYTYQMKIDTGNSLYYLLDNTQNGFGFESDPVRVWMQNASSSIVELVKEVMTAKVGDKIQLIAGNKLEVETPLSTFSGDVQIAGNVTIGGSLSVGGNISSGGNISAPKMTLAGRDLESWLDSKD